MKEMKSVNLEKQENRMASELEPIRAQLSGDPDDVS
jgi:hypothetical protein